MNESKEFTVKELRSLTGLTQVEFANEFHIKRRTLEDWERGINKTPETILYLLNRVVKMDLLKIGNNVLEKAQSLNEYNTYLPNVKILNQYKLSDVWDGEGDAPEDSYSYLLTHNGENGEYNIDIWLNYKFEIVSFCQDDPCNSTILITGIELL